MQYIHCNDVADAAIEPWWEPFCVCDLAECLPLGLNRSHHFVRDESPAMSFVSPFDKDGLVGSAANEYAVNQRRTLRAVVAS